MDTIYSKTAKGVREAAGKTRTVSRDLRTLLVAIDGKMSVSELLDKTGGWSEGDLRKALGTLVAEGYIREPVASAPMAGAAASAAMPAADADQLADLDFTAPPAAAVPDAGAAQREAEERARRLGEEAANRESQERARREAAETASRVAEARAKRLTEEAAKREREERAKREAAEAASRKAEAQVKRLAEEAAKRESEERARREAAEAASRKAEAEAKRLAAEAAKREREERAKREAAEAARREAEAQVKRLADEAAKRESEERAKREAAEAARREAEAEAKRLAEEAAKREREERAKREAAEAARREAEAEARRLAAEAAKREREEREERARREAEEVARRAAEAEAKRLAEEAAKREREERAKREAAEAASREAEERAQRLARQAEARDADERAAEQARREAEQRARRQEAEQARRLADEARRREAEAGRREDDARAARKAEERSRAAEHARPVQRTAPGRGRRLFPVLAGGSLLLAVLGLLLLHVVPFDGRIPRFEQAIAERLQQPVNIKSLRLALLPRPHWRLEDVEIGDAGQIRAPRIDAFMTTAALFGDQGTFDAIEAAAPSLTAEGLGWLLFRTQRGVEPDLVRIAAAGAKLDVAGIALPPLEVDAEIGDEGNWQRIRASSAEDKVDLVLQRKGEAVELRFAAAAFAVPAADMRPLQDFSASGTVDRDALRLAEFEGRAFGGTLSGSALLRWQAAPSLDGEVAAARVDAAQLLPGLFGGGALDGQAKFSLPLADAEKPSGVPRAAGSFVVRKGVLATVDLGQVLRDAGGAGRTAFTALEGDVAYDGGKTQLRRLRLDAGALSARGSVDVGADGVLGGAVSVELSRGSDRHRGDFAVSGGAAARRGEGIAWKRR